MKNSFVICWSAETTEAFRYGQVIGMQITKKYINKQEPISLESKQLLIRHKKHKVQS